MASTCAFMATGTCGDRPPDPVIPRPWPHRPALGDGLLEAPGHAQDGCGCDDWRLVALGKSEGQSEEREPDGKEVDLAVAPKSPREAVKATRDVREAVRKELEFDPLIDASGITVKNMNGDVALNGTVPSYPQYLEAAAAAKRVQGVTRVHIHLMVELPLADYRNDAMLTTAANNALATALIVPGNVQASASEGDVWLTGMVSNRFERDAAERVIAGLAGVRGIIDDIEFLSDIEAGDVNDLVLGALDRYGLLADDSDVRVDASDGTVIVTGHIRTWAEHDAVMDAVWRGVGVRNVRDNLVVTG